jgi:hypothetical protein
LSDEEHDTVVRILEEIARAMITNEVPTSARVEGSHSEQQVASGHIR